MIRRKTLIFIISVFIFWFFIIFKLNSLLSIIKDGTYGASNNIGPDNLVTINYFKRFYKKSINTDNKMPGEKGAPVIIEQSANKEKDLRYFLHKFNELASSRISLLRTFPEKRKNNCFNRLYPLDLPTASIIIIYHNEAWSTLLRTVHTSLSRAPNHLINEIILVDDYSDYQKFPYLLKDLDEHFKNLTKVIIIRSDKRIGLTVARLKGARRATGDVLIFLDSHCESLEGWLEPLLDDIKTNPRMAITPVIEVIDLDTFSISESIIHKINVGSFTWKADFTWFVPKDQDDNDKIIKSPTMAGGLFAIGRDFFFESGSYDDKMTFWGGENIEMSFRLWTCADGIYSDPCSIIGHVFRKTSPHDMAKNSVFYNKLRAVEVWMDEYKSIVYSKIGIKEYDTNAGSIEERVELRKQLKCKPFKWYIQNICTHKRVPGSSSYIKNVATNLCIDSGGVEAGKEASVQMCHNHGGNQNFEIDKSIGAIISDELCLDLSKGFEGAEVLLYTCHFSGGNQEWFFLDNKHIKHSIFGNCLQVDQSVNKLVAKACDTENIYQEWEFSYSTSLV